LSVTLYQMPLYQLEMLSFALTSFVLLDVVSLKVFNSIQKMLSIWVKNSSQTFYVISFDISIRSKA
jgi:hypothetical protein